MKIDENMGIVLTFLIIGLTILGCVYGYLYHQDNETQYEKCIEECGNEIYQGDYVNKEIANNQTIICIDNCKVIMELLK